VAADSGIGLVEDGARVEQALHGAEDLLDHPELLVFQGDLDGGERGVGAQHTHAVEALLLQCFFAVDGQGALGGLEIAPVSLVGDQVLRAAAELLLKRGEHLRPRGGVLGGLLRIVADDVAARPLPVPADPDLLDLCISIGSGRWRSASTVSRTSLVPRNRAPRMYAHPRASTASTTVAGWRFPSAPRISTVFVMVLILPARDG